MRPNLTREVILQAAASLFAEKGYAATTTRELADRLSVTRASLYYHVDSKEVLLYEVCIEALASMRKAIDARLAKAGTAEGRLRALIEAHVTEILARQDQTMTMLLEMRALGDDRRKDVLELRDSYETLAQDVIREAQDDGVLRSDMDASDLALAMLNLVNWPVVWFRPSGPRSAAELGRQYADLFIEGSRTQK